MRAVLSSICMTFSMFSALPMPTLDWKKENMRYMLASLPLVGVLIGAVLVLWSWVCGVLCVGEPLYAAGMTLLPLLLSGGIHMDGFCDTADALASHAEPERRREILKDSHTGAFAVMAAAGYLLLDWAAYTELPRTPRAVLVAGVLFVLARAVGGLASALLPSSTSRGLLFTFTDAASQRVAVFLGGWAVLCAAALFLLCPVGAAVVLLLAAACFGFLWRTAMRGFGGMSGDLAGFLITLTELVTLLGFVFTCKVVAL